jgi:hypothetical protein
MTNVLRAFFLLFLVTFAFQAEASPMGNVKDNIYGGLSISDAYPNPASDQVRFDFTINNDVKSAKIVLHTVIGTVVTEQNLSLNGSNLTLDISRLNNGIYLYSIYVDGQVQATKRLIVK